MKRFLTFLFVIAASVAMVSCGKNKNRQSLLPNVSGKAGEVIVVLDRDSWEGAIGNELRETLACECPWLAQREPLYSLVNVTPAGFADLFKVHRNIVYLDINPQNASFGMTLRKDVWASPQCVIQISAADQEQALSIIREKSETMVNAIEQAERDRVIRNTMLYEERSIYDAVAEKMGGSPHFPMGYKLKKKTDDFVWISDEKQFTNQTVLIYRYPVTEGDPFTLDKIVKMRNEVMKANVPGMFDGTYMTTVDVPVPTVNFVKYKGLEFAQTRGFWEVHGDFMGGPFVSHSFYAPDGKSIIVTEAFVYAPKYDKRQYLRQVESILYSFQWKD